MEKSIKNKKISSLIKREISEIFLYDTSEKGIIISISKVLMNSNLVNAKFYLRVFPIQDKNKILRNIKKKSVIYRKILGKRLRNQLKKIPVIHFYLDESLEEHNCHTYLNFIHDR